MTIRITAGSLRGRRIPVPRQEVRPTSERARQAYFNIVGERIGGAAFLDLFAGSGIFAFEAISRGAARAVAVDASRQQTLQIEKTARDFGIEIRTVTADVLAGIERVSGEVFDLVYADPPYAYQQYDDLLMTLDTHLRLGPAGLVAIEHRRRTEPFTCTPNTLKFDRRAEYGEVWISFFIT
jgi:16S rRNA (guanine966-N2)-methyltransferase